MINELIEQIGGRERLKFIAENAISRERMIMARALLAVLDAKPIAALSKEDLLQLRNSYRPVLAFRPDHVRNNPAEYLYTIQTSASVPDGWKLVPLKASPLQWAAGQKAFDTAGINKVDAVYSAMVESAPNCYEVKIK